MTAARFPLAVLTGNPSDDAQAISAGTGRPITVGSGGGLPGATVFVQAVPATVWTITHGLGRLPLGIEVFDSTGLQRTPQITNPNSNTTVVTFNTPQTGSVVYA